MHVLVHVYTMCDVWLMNFIAICETCQTCNNNEDLIFCHKLDRDFFQNIIIMLITMRIYYVCT